MTKHQARPDPKAQSTLQKSYFACPACGKRAYDTRTIARRAARMLYPGYKMRVYQCHDTPWWHLTSQTAARAEKMRARYAPGPCLSTECDC